MSCKMNNSMLWVVVKLFVIYVYVMVEYGESSYSGGGGSANDHYHNYQNQIRRMALMKSSHSHVIRSTSLLPTREPSSTLPLPSDPADSNKLRSNGRVYHVTDYGADPTGISDSTEALELALSRAFASPIPIHDAHHLMQGVADLGGAQLHLDGGTYLIRRPLRFPHSGGGNFMIHGGSLRASDDFPRESHLIELPSSISCPDSNSMCYKYEDITLKDLMLDCNFRGGGGISILNSLRTIVDNCYISHFTTDGILIKGGHETYIKNCFMGQHINIGGDPREKDFSAIGINIQGNDNAVTDVVIFSAAVGVLVAGQANLLTGVHCYNKATTLGGVGIYVRSPGFTQTRIVNCYFDFTALVAEDPVQLHITGSFFLGNAFVSIRSLKGIACGVNIVDNMFSGDYTGVPIVQLDQTTQPSALPFTNIHQVVVDRNSVRGMMLKSTVAKGILWSNGTSWTLDFSRVLLFPNLINNVHYTLHLHAATDTATPFPNHILRNISGNRVTVESDKPVSATLHVTVDQIKA